MGGKALKVQTKVAFCVNGCSHVTHMEMDFMNKATEIMI